MIPSKTKLNPVKVVTWPLMLCLASTLFFTSCDNNDQVKKDTEDFKTYVQNHKDSADMYMDEQWDKLEAEYNERKAKLEMDTAKMGQEVRSNYNEAVNNWEQFKADYTTRKQEKENEMAQADMEKLRVTLVTEDAKSDYTGLTATNIKNVYEHFVSTVKGNKDTYTKEQWTTINNTYKALNDAKQNLAKDITAADKKIIGELQLEYTAIKAVNRPFADTDAEAAKKM